MLTANRIKRLALPAAACGRRGGCPRRALKPVAHPRYAALGGNSGRVPISPWRPRPRYAQGNHGQRRLSFSGDTMPLSGNPTLLRYGVLAAASLIALWIVWPFNSVPTLIPPGTRKRLFTVRRPPL